MDWIKASEDVVWNIRPFIGGSYRSSASSEMVENINPSNERVLCDFAAGHAADVDEAVAIARAQFEKGVWANLPPARRVAVLNRWADLIVRDKDELALLDTMEMGRPISATLGDATSLAPNFIRLYAGFADKLYGQAAPLEDGMIWLNSYAPRGVVGAITPWNFPMANLVIKAAPALAAGNSVVVKPSEVSPSSALKLAELAIEAGIPEGVLNIVPGLGASVGMALALHADVDLLSFTGSTNTGRRIMELAGRSNGKPLLLECGGKSPHIVCDDVDIENVASAIVNGFVANQGQICHAHTRVIVQEKIHSRLLSRVVDLARGHVPGLPLEEQTTFGALATPAQRDRVAGYMAQAVKEGAEVALMGEVQKRGGCFVSPSVFDQTKPGMKIFQEEIFGPVLCVTSYSSAEEAVALANDTPYGLAATIWTRDLGRGRRLANAINAGRVHVRTSGEEAPASGYWLSSAPHKASGFGSEIGIEGLKSYSSLKSVSFSGG